LAGGAEHWWLRRAAGQSPAKKACQKATQYERYKQAAAPIRRAGAAAIRTPLAICGPGPMSRPQSFGVKSGIFFQSRM